MKAKRLFARLIVSVGAVFAWSPATTVTACPFCTVESRTLTEEITASDAVVLGKLVAEAAPTDLSDDTSGGFGPADPDTGMAKFEVVDVLHGADHVAVGDEIDVVYFGENEPDKLFFITGISIDGIEWTTPLPLSETAVEYVQQLPSVPSSGADRLAFFQEYFESDDPLLAQDSYDEFARAPYDDLKALKDRMHHDKLVQWIASPEVNPSRRRLYLTMLGVCGDESDLPMLEEMILSDFRSKEPVLKTLVSSGLALGGPIGLPAWIESVELTERRKKLGLDAMIACYLTLRGPDGLDLIDQRFLADPEIDYSQGYSTIMALRFLGEETEVVPRERLLESMRLMLNNENFADQVILDLSRWEDWTVLDRLVELFKQSNDKSYVRQPVVTYLTVASEQPGDVGERATAALAELEALDPEAVKKARSLMAFGYLTRARAGGDSTGATRPESDEADDDDREPRITEANLETAAFAASPEDIAAAEEEDADDIPDPATFGSPDAEAMMSEIVVDEAATAKSGSDDANEPTRTTSETASSPASLATYSPVLVVGVPLIAAVLLMGVYWLILRIGVV